MLRVAGCFGLLGYLIKCPHSAKGIEHGVKKFGLLGLIGFMEFIGFVGLKSYEVLQCCGCKVSHPSFVLSSGLRRTGSAERIGHSVKPNNPKLPVKFSHGTRAKEKEERIKDKGKRLEDGGNSKILRSKVQD
jgi:hypothetical protein